MQAVFAPRSVCRTQCAVFALQKTRTDLELVGCALKVCFKMQSTNKQRLEKRRECNTQVDGRTRHGISVQKEKKQVAGRQTVAPVYWINAQRFGHPKCARQTGSAFELGKGSLQNPLRLAFTTAHLSLSEMSNHG